MPSIKASCSGDPGLPKPFHGGGSVLSLLHTMLSAQGSNASSFVVVASSAPPASLTLMVLSVGAGAVSFSAVITSCPCQATLPASLLLLQVQNLLHLHLPALPLHDVYNTCDNALEDLCLHLLALSTHNIYSMHDNVLEHTVQKVTLGYPMATL